MRLTSRISYLIFGLGMLVLVVGVSLSVWIFMTRIISDDGPTPGGDAPILTAALAQAMGLSEVEAEELAERLQAAAIIGRVTDLAEGSGGEIPLAEVLRQVLLLTNEEADDLVTRLQAAVLQAQSTAAEDRDKSLTETFQQTLGLSEQEADELADRLIAAAEAAGGGGTDAVTSGGGTGVKTDLGDSIEFEVRDGSGNLKQQGSSR